jgi:hypothetical protein
MCEPDSRMRDTAQPRAPRRFFVAWGHTVVRAAGRGFRNPETKSKSQGRSDQNGRATISEFRSGAVDVLLLHQLARTPTPRAFRVFYSGLSARNPLICREAPLPSWLVAVGPHGVQVRSKTTANAEFPWSAERCVKRLDPIDHSQFVE